MEAGAVFGTPKLVRFTLTLRQFRNLWGRETAITAVMSLAAGAILTIPLAVTWALVDLAFTPSFRFHPRWLWYCFFPALVPVIILDLALLSY